MNNGSHLITVDQLEAILTTSFRRMFPDTTIHLVPEVFDHVQAMFEGRHPDYQASDTPYHNLQHTMQVLLCYNGIMEGWHMSGTEPRLTPRQYELGACAVLFHDTGYLKLRADTQGTGAKYTFTHVLRSCSFAASYLPRHGITLAEIDSILAMIGCTAFTQGSRHFRFQEPIDGIVGCAVATADYLGQIAAPDYPESLPLLFSELKESDDYANTPPAERRFKTLDELVTDTPVFWCKYVQPRLEKELLGVYRFLARPYPDGPNAYIDAANANIERIEKRLKD
ncbi:hypothetical protein M2103_000425 [Ereboglobus sp. PH5-5]|uniref:hypothetical protein n=1 Tax=unclassified Ereboglobus TaxID=2626932 RepID=UPI002404BAE7|nr:MULTISPECIES: hypothetical protein [unclassified Ereboglobus]MDF9826199.1 hypothetical protein [Ereboglobus sp. PH5-10]MDF9832217.1 hypothetical protein [Ereboglobus sp. PH5-5]